MPPPPVGYGPYAPSAFRPGLHLQTEPLPPRRRSSQRGITVAVVIVILLAAALAAIAIGSHMVSHDGITRSTDVAVGDCVTVTGDNDDVTAKKASCDGPEFSYVVAQTYTMDSLPCTALNSAEITSPDMGKLCLAPNLKTGRCYEFPTRSPGPISAIKEADCTGAPAPTATSTSVVVRVITRAPRQLTPAECPSGKIFEFADPNPLDYCLQAANPQ